MRTRFHLCLIVALAACLAAPATAQTVPQPGPEKPAPDAKGEWVQPPAKLPNVAGDPTRNLDLLFKALKAAPNDEIAKAIEHRIWAVWAVSRSDTTNVLMTRVRTAFEKHDVDLALKLLDAIVKIKPDYVEAWNRRATVYFTKKDYGRAMADLREVLKREPRHFGALSALESLAVRSLAPPLSVSTIDLLKSSRVCKIVPLDPRLAEVAETVAIAALILVSAELMSLSSCQLLLLAESPSPLEVRLPPATVRLDEPVSFNLTDTDPPPSRLVPLKLASPAA